jgi:hypothetical protein
MTCASVRRSYLTLLAKDVPLCCYLLFVYRVQCTLFSSTVYKDIQTLQTFVTVCIFLIKSNNQHLHPHFSPSFVSHLSHIPPPPQAKITLHLVFVELQSFPFQNITWHLPTGTVEARPIVSFHSVFHLTAIRGQLFPIRLAVCGLDSRGFIETISGLKAGLYSYTDRSVSSDCYSY